MSDIAAKVNGKEIFVQELDEMVHAYKQQMRKAEISGEEKKVLLENLVEENKFGVRSIVYPNPQLVLGIDERGYGFDGEYKS